MPTLNTPYFLESHPHSMLYLNYPAAGNPAICRFFESIDSEY